MEDDVLPNKRRRQCSTCRTPERRRSPSNAPLRPRPAPLTTSVERPASVEGIASRRSVTVAHVGIACDVEVPFAACTPAKPQFRQSNSADAEDFNSDEVCGLSNGASTRPSFRQPMFTAAPGHLGRRTSLPLLDELMLSPRPTGHRAGYGRGASSCSLSSTDSAQGISVELFPRASVGAESEVGGCSGGLFSDGSSRGTQHHQRSQPLPATLMWSEDAQRWQSETAAFFARLDQRDLHVVQK